MTLAEVAEGVGELVTRDTTTTVVDVLSGTSLDTGGTGGKLVLEKTVKVFISDGIFADVVEVYVSGTISDYFSNGNCQCRKKRSSRGHRSLTIPR